MVSTIEMVDKLKGCLGKGDLNIHEQRFVQSMLFLKARDNLANISERQINWLNDLYKRHFT
ncbi:MAG TPA: hypothetical protein VF928_12710 [Usitatibacteraceae bacterium]